MNPWLVALDQAVPADSVRHAVRAVFARPEYQWGEPGPLLRWLTTWWRWLQSALASLDAGHPVMARAVFWGAIVALLAIVAHFGYVAWRIYRATVRPVSARAAPTGMRLEDARAYLARADELANAGRFSEALAYRFMALLLQLERAHVVQVHPSKTPFEYVGEARLDAGTRLSLGGLVDQLYRHVFGGEPCDARAYDDFGTAAQRLSENVAPA